MANLQTFDLGNVIVSPGNSSQVGASFTQGSGIYNFIGLYNRQPSNQFNIGFDIKGAAGTFKQVSFSTTVQTDYYNTGTFSPGLVFESLMGSDSASSGFPYYSGQGHYYIYNGFDQRVSTISANLAPGHYWLEVIPRGIGAGEVDAHFKFQVTASGLTATPTIKIKSLSTDPNTVMADEGGLDGKVHIDLSEAYDKPIDVKVEIGGFDWQSDVRLINFTIPQGVTSADFAVVTALKDGIVEEIESGDLRFSAIIDEQEIVESESRSLKIQIRDEIVADAASEGYVAGSKLGKDIIKYIKDSTKVGAAFEGIKDGTAGGNYVKGLGEVAKFASVAIDGTSVTLVLNKTLAASEQLGNQGKFDEAAALAYSAYEDANVNFLNSLIKSSVAVGLGAAGSGFVGGLVLGLTGVAAAAAIPVLTTVAIGWGTAVLYDEYFAPIVKDVLRQEFELNNNKNQFLIDYKNYLGENNPPIIPKLSQNVDIDYYKYKYQDVAAANIDPAVHYNEYGWHEGRDPSAFFSTNGYLAANPDVAKAGVNPLTHFDQNGWKEGRDPSASFDNELYLGRNSDVKAAGVDPLLHYLSNGQAEGRQAYAAVGKAADLGKHPGFDAEYYLLSNADVAKAALAAGGDTFAFAYQHYASNGWHEGRNPNAVFDTKGYLAAYKDIAAANIDPLAHYHSFGFKEGRDPSAHFDTKGYLAANGDVKAAGFDPMLHYLQFGGLEGRTMVDDGHFG